MLDFDWAERFSLDFVGVFGRSARISSRFSQPQAKLMNWDDFDIWWRERGDEKQLSQMRAQLEAALQPKPARDIEYSIRWRLARWHHFAAMQLEANGDRKSAHEHFVLGRQQAARAIFLDDDVAGHFWLGVCLLEAARTQNPFAALLVLEHARLRLQLALERDESFHHAGTLRVLGRMAHRTPPLFGGRKTRALGFYRRALQVAPDNSTTQLYIAELLLAMKRKPEATRTLQQIISQPRDDDWVWEQNRDREKARALLQKLRR